MQAQWDNTTVFRGDTLTLQVTANNFEDGDRVKIQIMEMAQDGTEKSVKTMNATIASGKADSTWNFNEYEDTGKILNHEAQKRNGMSYVQPQYFFVVSADGIHSKSNIVSMFDKLEIELDIETLDPWEEIKYKIELADGSTLNGESDDEGKILEDKVVPGMVTLRLPEIEDADLSVKDVTNNIIIDTSKQNYVGIQFPSGKKQNFRRIPPAFVIDAHMHIQSGRTAPLPLLWGQSPINLFWRLLKNRKTIESISKFPLVKWLATGKTGDIQNKTTFGIAQLAKTQNNAVYQNEITYPDTDLFTTMVALPMDMDYAHIAGYDGIPIYQKDNKGEYFTRVNRKSGADKYEDGKLVELKNEFTTPKYPDPGLFESWQKQVEYTIQAAETYPWEFLPMLHYDPRRWKKYDVKTSFIPKIATKQRQGIFSGVKMYTSLGYMPTDPRLPNLMELYRECAANGIPIMCHCTDGGMYTHERALYWDLSYADAHDPNSSTSAISRQLCLEAKQTLCKWKDPITDDSTDVDERLYDECADPHSIENVYNKNIKEFFFNWHFVHPQAWRKVLDQVPDLTLCLAHFAGDAWSFYPEDVNWISDLVYMMENHPNAYTDISYFFVKEHKEKFVSLLKKHPKIIDKIMFGTDWYMTELSKYDYSKFCTETKKYLDEVSQVIGKDLWTQFSVVNSMRYLSLPDRANSFATELKFRGASRELVDKGLSILKRYDEKVILEAANKAT